MPRAHQWNARLGEVLDILQREHGRTLGLGTVVPLPSCKPAATSTYMSGMSRVPLRVADPELWRVPGSGWEDAKPLTTTAQQWSYLTPMPDRVSATWVDSVLNAQRDHGASVLLSATGWVDLADGARSLSTAMDWARESRQRAGGGPLWINLTMDSRWLSDDGLRNTLIDEIVESNERDWYLRFWWPEVTVRYGQLVDDAVLRGYRELAAACSMEDKNLFAPNSGLTGWIATALGARGFSTGQSWAAQAFARQRRIAARPGQPPPPRIPRIFDWTILHTIEHQEFSRLRTHPGHQTLNTAFLQEIDMRGHRPELAGLHYLVAVGGLTATLSGSHPNYKVARRVRQAQKFIDSLKPIDQPAGINRPAHLARWHHLVS